MEANRRPKFHRLEQRISKQSTGFMEKMQKALHSERLIPVHQRNDDTTNSEMKFNQVPKVKMFLVPVSTEALRL